MDIDRKRFAALMRDQAELTQEEIDAGWHFCYEWDGLLVGPNMGEMEYCTCARVNKEMHKELRKEFYISPEMDIIMTKEHLEKIKEEVEFEREIANKILCGEHDGYDGADGARTARRLCSIIADLIDTIERTK